MHNKSELFKKKLIDYFSDIVESHKRHLDSLRKDDFKRSYFKGKKINPKKTTKNQKDLFNKKFNKFKRDQLNKYSTKKYHFENFPLYLKSI